ncbi:small secreted domain DUF320 [Stackebrandtia albiflava]|uniref:Small secreted domain DUF320 n=1 Tax=Stackebrandtia albiflava TaxID=406432 RepID=A0A562ULM0_9ACTN|nr:chaplin family protein [Stackebrandtia albiflava]TWJ06502.1 small secreted domain DUF320 [Stackebrandtia albiflava]
MSKRVLRNVSVVGAMAAGAILAAGGAAQAAPDVTSVGNNGILNGNQAVVPIQVPINVCGNAVAVLGVAGAGCDGGASADMGHGGRHESGALGDMVSAGNNGIANGNQVQAPIQVPVNVCGNAVGALIGVAGAGCDGGADADLGHGGHDREGGKVTEAKNTALTAGNQGIGNGNQLIAPIQVPVNVCGNAIAVLGVAGAGCDGGADADLGHHAAPDMVSAGNNGILNGNQAFVPIQVPVDISGNAIAVAGVAGAGSTGGADADLGPSR